MNLKKVLTESCVCIDLKGVTKEEVIGEMVDALVAAGKISDRSAAFECVMEREQRMATGMQFGIAIPHGKSASVTGLQSAIGTSQQGVDFGSHDGQICRIFIMTLSPAHITGPHMQYLAEISKLLLSPVRRQAVVEARSREEILKILSL